MKELIINENDAGHRIDKFLSKAVKPLPKSLMYKYIRLKRIKINNKRCEISSRLKEGDRVQLYINDEFFYQNNADSFFNAPNNINVVYEDENILIADKPSGLVVHEDNSQSFDTLINRIKKYLYEKGEYEPEKENSFAPALCNRLDRNTSGLIVCAKNSESLKILNQKIKDREVHKQYLCATLGRFNKNSGRIENYLFKDEKSNRVKIENIKTNENKTAVTEYKVLKCKNNLSLVKINLITGRTHQIRAHMAHIGHPILGDGKYGDYAENKKYGVKTQALCAYTLEFDFSTDAGILEYLNHREFKSKEPWFLKKLFDCENGDIT